MDDLTSIIQLFIDLGLKIIPLLAAIAVFAFIFGVAKFIKSSSNEKEKSESKNILVWGIVGLFVMVTIWGIIWFLKTEFFGMGGEVGIPQIEL